VEVVLELDLEQEQVVVVELEVLDQDQDQDQEQEEGRADRRPSDRISGTMMTAEEETITTTKRNIRPDLISKSSPGLILTKSPLEQTLIFFSKTPPLPPNQLQTLQNFLQPRLGDREKELEVLEAVRKDLLVFLVLQEVLLDLVLELQRGEEVLGLLLLSPDHLLLLPFREASVVILFRPLPRDQRKILMIPLA